MFYNRNLYYIMVFFLSQDISLGLDINYARNLTQLFKFLQSKINYLKTVLKHCTVFLELFPTYF